MMHVKGSWVGCVEVFSQISIKCNPASAASILRKRYLR